MFKKAFLLAIAALAIGAGFAYSQGGGMGMWSNWPLVGTQSYCSSYVNGSCVNVVPPGEASLTGYEVIPNDTHLTGGVNPQSQLMTVSNLAQIGEGSERNALRGGDFLVNLWQRGTTFSSLTPTTTTMTADGWGVYSSGNTVTIAQDTTAADLSQPLGINGAMKITRPSGTNTTAICVVQVLPQKESQRFIGKQAIFSFYADALTGFLSTNNNIVATIAVYTAGDSATPGTNTDAFAKGTVTGYTVINPTSASVTTAPNLPITTSWARYSVNGFVPTQVNVSGTLTNVSGIGVQICTPVYPASTGVAGDGFLIANAQLEPSTPAVTTTIPGPGGTTVTVPVANANTIPGGFARRAPSAEWVYEQSYSFVLIDGATTRVYPGFAVETTANTSAAVTVNFPTTMREIPTTTVGTATSFSVRTATGSANACTALTAVSTSNTVNSAGLACAAAGTVAAGVASQFVGANTAGVLTFSAEP